VWSRDSFNARTFQVALLCFAAQVHDFFHWLEYEPRENPPHCAENDTCGAGHILKISITGVAYSSLINWCVARASCTTEFGSYTGSFGPKGMMKRLCLLVLGLIASLGTSPALAADALGRHLIGGGAGVALCTQFLNAMAEARQKGGLRSVSGVWEVESFLSYVLGFETGYNYSTPGVLDIFSALGPDPSFEVLYGIEPWCQRHPTIKFGEALIIFAERLRKTE